MALESFEFTDYLHEDFQFQLLGLLLQDQDFLQRARGIIKPGYFHARWMRVLCEALFAIWDERHVVPPRISLHSALALQATDMPTLEAWCECVERVYDLPPEDLDREFVEKHLAWFAQRVEAATVIRQAGADIRQFDIPAVTAELERIARIPATFMEFGVSVRDDWWDVLEADDREVFITGCTGLDTMLRGGLREGELISFMAPLKGFKSGLLQNIASWYLRCGYVVLYVTLEMYELDVMARIISIFSNIPTNQLQAPGSITTIMDTMEYLSLFTKGQCIIRDFPGSALTVKHLDGYLQLVRARMGTRVIPIIDYADRMLPERTRGSEEWQMLPELYDELRAMGKRHGVPIITATQTNVQGFTATKLGAQHQRGASGKGMVADYMPAINQSPSDYAVNRFTLDLMLARHARKHTTVYFQVDYETARLREITEQEYTALDPSQGSAPGGGTL